MLKGKSVIELTDVRTNSKEIYEDENLITNAVPDLLRLNPSGLMYPLDNGTVQFKDEIFPIANKCYGGILLFENPLEEDPNKIIAPSDNPIIGYASNDVNDTDNSKRGSANLTESKPIDRGYKFIWDFSTSQGNGRISSLALTHYRGGKSFYGNSYDRESGILMLNKVSTKTDKAILSYYAGLVEVNLKDQSFYSIWPMPDRQIQIAKIKESFFNIGLNDTILGMPTQEVEVNYIKPEKFFPSRYSINCSFHDGEDGYWYGFSTEGETNSRGNVEIYTIKIKKEDFSFTEDKWVLENVQLQGIGRYPSSENESHYRTIGSVVRGKYLYCLNYKKNGVYKININNPVDITLINLENEVDILRGEYTNQYFYKYGDYVATRQFLIDKNDNVIYTATVDMKFLTTPLINIGPFMIGFDTDSGYGNYTLYKLLFLHTQYLGTINNLSSPILKTADKTMKITYTVTEEE